MHPRRAILEDLRGQVKFSNQFGGCWIQRAPPRRQAWPCVTLNTESEIVETLEIHASPRYQDRLLNVDVHAWVKGTPDIELSESAMDDAAEKLEMLLVKPKGADTFELTGTNFFMDEEEPEIHRITLSYRISYTVLETLEDPPDNTVVTNPYDENQLFDADGSPLTDSEGSLLTSLG